MASMLRSSKFVRYVAGFARNALVGSSKDIENRLFSSAQCMCSSNSSHNYSTQTSVISDHNLETSLRRIDQDVKRSGRISRRDIEEVLEEIRNNKSATSSQSLLVIRCCGNLVPEELPEMRTALVKEIWNTLNRLNIPMDISHYNALLRVYLENEHPFSPVDFLAELESKGIEPNRVTYQRLISRYCQDGNIDGATKILHYMREKQISVNENVFNALIVGHSKTGDMDSAEGIINVMSKAGLEPSADTYTTLLSGYAMNGDIEKICKLIDECEKQEIFLLDKDYLDIIYSLAINGYMNHISKVLEKVKKMAGYNQDAVNVILRLVNKGHEDAGLMILKSLPRNTKEDGNLIPSGTFFIKQLVKAKRPIAKIIQLCRYLEEERLHDRALLLATETSLQLGCDEIAFPLLYELRQKGFQIRQHFFWPLLASKSNDSDEIINILQKMKDFNIVPSSETLRDYVIPRMTGKSSEIIAQLREGNISVGLAASSLVLSLLQKKEIEEAAAIATKVPAFYNLGAIKKPLAQAFLQTKNLNAFIKLLRVVHENSDRRISSVSNDEDDSIIDKSEVIGSIVLELTSQSNFLEHIEAVLEKLVEFGLGISTPMAERFEEKLGEKMTEKISTLLGRLTSGELTPIPLEKKPPSYIPSHQMNIPQLERLIYNLSAKQKETLGLKRQLLTLYYRAKDLKKAESIYDQLENEKFIFTNGVYAQMLDLYAINSNVEKALEFLEKIQKNSQEKFSLDESKIVRLSYELVKAGRFEEGMRILEEIPKENRQGERGFAFASLVWRFLNFLAEDGNDKQLEILFDTLVKNEFIEVNNILLGPLIKVHLVRNDLNRALEKFEWCVNHFKATPWKNELACRLINSEDADKLQKLTDLSTTIHGEVNSLYDLVFAFVECGRTRQARKILETPGLQNRPQRINTACERYQQEGLILPLEGLKDATKDLNHIDRSDIYYQLLLSYIKQNDPEKALGLWTQMQEEDMTPTDHFLNTLGTFLKGQKKEVPFVIPQESEHATVPPKLTSQFRQKLQMDDIDEALLIKNTSKGKLGLIEISNLIEKLTHRGRLEEASSITLELLQKGNYPVTRVFRFLLNKLSVSGDVDVLMKFNSFISSDMKKNISFDNKICHAYLVAGKGEDYLNKLCEGIDSVSEEALAELAEQFPRGGAFGLLENGNLVEKFEDMAERYAKRGITGPVNVLWTYYFLRGNDQKAEPLWENFIKGSPRIMFQKIVQTVRETKDDRLAAKLVKLLKDSSITNGALGNAYSCLLDVLKTQGKDEEVINTFEEAIQHVSVDHLNRSAVLRVKEVYEKLEKPFEHNIPLRKKK